MRRRERIRATHARKCQTARIQIYRSLSSAPLAGLAEQRPQDEGPPDGFKIAQFVRELESHIQQLIVFLFFLESKGKKGAGTLVLMTENFIFLRLMTVVLNA